MDVGAAGPGAAELIAEQARLGRLAPPPWHPTGPVSVAGCFVAYQRGVDGPGRAGDHGWAGAAVVHRDGTTRSVVVEGVAGGPYVPGLLVAREGPMLQSALEALEALDVVLVDGTGRNHPRRAGLALHLGALLDIPTVGVTHRPLVADRQAPPLVRRGERAAIADAAGPVAAWVCTGDGLRPLVAHAAWRTDVEVAVSVVLAASTNARTPEPLRLARQAARRARAGQPPA